MIFTMTKTRKIWSFHGGEISSQVLSGCDAVLYCGRIPCWPSHMDWRFNYVRV